MIRNITLLCIAGIIATACSAPEEAAVETQSANMLSAPAELVSLEEVTIGPPNVRRMWQFKIEYLARENTLIKQGDTVVKFDGQRLRDDLIRRRSELDAAKKESEQKVLEDEQLEQDLVLALAEAKKDQDIARRKVEITDTSRSEVERAKERADFEIATARHQQARQKLDEHRQRMKINQQVSQANVANKQVHVDNILESIEKLTIRAPKDGMVVYLPDWEDNKPAVGDTVWMGRTLLALPSLDNISVKVEFDESDSAKVQTGQPVKLILDAYPERPFPGHISALGQAYREKSQRNPKVVFDAWVELDEQQEGMMRPGMKGTVQLQAEVQG